MASLLCYNSAMLQLMDISKDFAGNPLFTAISWHLKKGERVALVGENGAGKSTLMKIIAGLSEPSSGEIQIARGAKAAYLPQDGIVTSGRTLFHEARTALSELLAMEEELHRLGQDLELLPHDSAEHMTALQRYGELQDQFRHRGGYTMEAEIGTVLKGLGFSQADWQRDCGEFSGGWQMRIALARLLLQKPDVLLLDEPTNHLDIEARNWLEEYLCSYPGSVILVSHDRFFMDRVCSRISRGLEPCHHRLPLQLLQLSLPARGAGHGPAGGQATPGRGDREDRGFHPPLPLPGQQGLAGAVTHQAAGKGRTDRASSGTEKDPVSLPTRPQKRQDRHGAERA